MIKISLALLDKQPIDLCGEEPAAILDLDGGDSLYRVASPVGYELHAQMVGGDVLVKGSFRYRIAGCCGRCLEETGREIAGEICLFFAAPAAEELDISDDFREEALLALPMSLFCGEDCRGICPVCGANRNREDCRCEAADEAAPPTSPWSALDELSL